MEKLEITAVDVRGFKRIDALRVETSGHRNLLLVAGKNTAGKSSLMDALTAAFGGAGELPPDPVRRGADKAEIVVELEGGRYTITRVIVGRGKDAKTSLRITGPDGDLRSPQTWLTSLVSGRFLDPVRFLTKDAKDQRRELLALVGVDVDGIDVERKRVFDKRTEENKAREAARAQRTGVEDLPPAPQAARSADVVQAEIDQVDAAIVAGEAATREHQRFVDAVQRLEESVAGKVARLEELRAQVAKLEGEVAAERERIDRGHAAVAVAAVKLPNPAAAGDLLIRRTELRAELSRSAAATAHQARAEERDRQIARLDAEVAKRESASKALTAELAAIDQRKVDLLAAAKMPVPELSIGDDGLLLGGVPFAQASQAERLRCALAIAMRQSPRFRDVWVHDGALLDEDGIALVRSIAEELDCRVWLEVVGEREAGAIVIRDGKVAAGGEP